MRVDELDFHLPPELIAQAPTSDRAASRLLHYRRSDRSIAHRTFADLPDILRPGDLLVFNDARVTPARFTLVKPTGGVVEGLLVSQTQPRRWQVMLKNLGGRKPDAALTFADDPQLRARAVEKHDDATYTIEVDTDEPANAVLDRIGRMPLPPYIRRDKVHDPRDAADRERYQTVYAQAPGSIAAPTAGLHFTPAVIDRLHGRGVETAFLTLHVGLGTFKPVVVDEIEKHDIHEEHYSLPPACCDQVNRAKREGRRVIAVGTTTARVLESQPAHQPLEPKTSSTRIFIYPGYAWRHTDALITNFHLPRSTLIALVAAWIGLDEQRRIYADAIAQHYRFFSYGDASLLE
jgi:S-adenosylmethionine:tRNA ribosyltransferase-isomerase